ncbi:MAG TPA: hypothetical protein VNA88_01645 [Candidatus Kapabacteria bacterium]|jgi:hypothetical protein|nr:hypothetical protein [Candidatus Kapabacteria bacterium]
MRIIPLLLPLTLLAVTAHAATRTMSVTDMEGRTGTAEVTIDDVTHHVLTVAGVDFEGRSYCYTLTPFVVNDFSSMSGQWLKPRSIFGRWYDFYFDSDGRLSSIGRFGGPGYSSEMVAYRVADATDDAVIDPQAGESQDYR